MADYQLTQTGNEVQAILTTVASAKMFRILTATNSAELDAIPSVNADWVTGIYDSSWASRPSSYGICFRVTSSTQQWSWEIALSTETPSPNLFVRTSINGNAWTSWATK